MPEPGTPQRRQSRGGLDLDPVRRLARGAGRAFSDGAEAVRRQIEVRRGQVQVEGAEQLPAGGFILAAAHLDRLDGAVLRRTLSQLPPQRPVLVLAPSQLPDIELPGPDGEGLWAGHRNQLRDGAILVAFPQEQVSPDHQLYKAKVGFGRLVLHTGTPVVPAMLDLPGQVLHLGAPLHFERFAGLPVDRTLARGVADEVSAALVQVSGMDHVDSHVEAAVHQRRERVRQEQRDRADQWRRTREYQREAEIRRQREAEDERRELAEAEQRAAQEARARARRAAARDRARRNDPSRSDQPRINQPRTDDRR